MRRHTVASARRREKRVVMDEEILDALTKANAVDQGSGLTIGKLMEITGKDREAVVGRVRSMKRDQKARVQREPLARQRRICSSSKYWTRDTKLGDNQGKERAQGLDTPADNRVAWARVAGTP